MCIFMKIDFSKASAFVDHWWNKPVDFPITHEPEYYFKHLEVFCEKYVFNQRNSTSIREKDAAWQLLCMLTNHERLNHDVLNKCLDIYGKEVVKLLQKHILDEKFYLGNAKFQKNTLDFFSELFSLLNYMIDEGNYEGVWELCLLNSMQRRKSRINPFNEPKNWELALNLSKFEAGVYKLLGQDDLDDATLLGALSFSLMKDALVFDDSKISIIMNYLLTASDLKLINSRVFIPPSVFTQGHGLGFYLPVITEMIFYRLKLSKLVFPFDGDVLAWLTRLVRSVKSLIDDHRNEKWNGYSPKSFNPQSMKQWRRAVVALVRQRQPSFIVHFALGEMPSYGLKHEGSLRIFGFEDQYQEKDLIKVEPKAIGSTINFNGALWRDIGRIFEGKRVDKGANNSIEQVICELRDLINHKIIDDNHLLILRYAVSALTEKQHNHTVTSPSKVMHRLSSVGKKLVMFAGNLSITQLTDTDRVDLYQRVIATAQSQEHDKTMRYNLSRFDQWLTASDLAPTLSEEDREELFDGADSNRGHVNANLLTIDELSPAM